MPEFSAVTKLAACSGFVVPGAGHVVVGRISRGVWLFFWFAFFLNGIAPLRNDVFRRITGSDHAEAAPNRRSDNLGDEILADCLPDGRDLIHIQTQKNRSLDTRLLPFARHRLDRRIAKCLRVLQIESFPNGIFQRLRVKQFRLLPKRNLQVQARRQYFFQHSAPTIINARDIPGRYGNEQPSQHLLHHEGVHELI